MIPLLVNKYEGVKEDEKDYITNFTRKFDGLPKIHKSNQIQQEVITQISECIVLETPTDMKFRPIVAGCNC